MITCYVYIDSRTRCCNWGAVNTSFVSITLKLGQIKAYLKYRHFCTIYHSRDILSAERKTKLAARFFKILSGFIMNVVPVCLDFSFMGTLLFFIPDLNRCNFWQSVAPADVISNVIFGNCNMFVWYVCFGVCLFNKGRRGLAKTYGERTTKPTIRPRRPAKTQTSLYIHPVRQEFLFIPLWISRRL